MMAQRGVCSSVSTSLASSLAARRGGAALCRSTSMSTFSSSPWSTRVALLTRGGHATALRRDGANPSPQPSVPRLLFFPKMRHHRLSTKSFASSSFSSSSSSKPPTNGEEPKGALGAFVGAVANKSTTTGDRDLAHIFAQNRHWKAEKEAQDPHFFHKLGSGHAPRYMWIGCADARVPANEIMGEDAGSVFVVRNVANLVVHIDFNLMSALQYAVNVLRVEHIIVCGHYDCGGVRAAVQVKDHKAPLENWLRNIRDVYRLHRTELDTIVDAEARHRRLVELNVIEQCLNLFKTGTVQRSRVRTRHQGLPYTLPYIHACVFDPKDGILQPLPVHFHEYMDELHSIYDLYSAADDDDN